MTYHGIEDVYGYDNVVDDTDGDGDDDGFDDIDG